MSATETAPQCIRPGSKSCPSFLRKKVTVCVALTAGPITAPVEPLIPLGKSTARIGAGWAFIASIVAGQPFGGPIETGAEQSVDNDVGADPTAGSLGGQALSISSPPSLHRL